jgi:hypothetical protein
MLHPPAGGEEMVMAWLRAVIGLTLLSAGVAAEVWCYGALRGYWFLFSDFSTLWFAVALCGAAGIGVGSYLMIRRDPRGRGAARSAQPRA